MPKHKRQVSSALLYERLMSLPLPKSQNFVNMPAGFHAMPPASRVDHYPQPSSWSDIACDTERVVAGRFEIKTLCRGGRSPLGRYKLFVRLTPSHGGRRRMRNLYGYARHLQTGHITRSQHISLFDVIEHRRTALEATLGHAIAAINENREVPLLHFKFVETDARSGSP